jgi:hypothetical protein
MALPGFDDGLINAISIRGHLADRKSEKDFAPRFETSFRFETQHRIQKTLVDNRIRGKKHDICAIRRANDKAWRGINRSIV